MMVLYDIKNIARYLRPWKRDLFFSHFTMELGKKESDQEMPLMLQNISNPLCFGWQLPAYNICWFCSPFPRALYAPPHQPSWVLKSWLVSVCVSAADLRSKKIMSLVEYIKEIWFSHGESFSKVQQWRLQWRTILLKVVVLFPSPHPISP